ncbi:MAG: hypothetical protein HY720_29055 [Planctomycetes bacterium]|nr:hypothetical protein [Planctomycetota bacterium]
MTSRIAFLVRGRGTALLLAALVLTIALAGGCRSREANYFDDPGQMGYDDSHPDSYQHYYGANRDHYFYHYPPADPEAVYRNSRVVDSFENPEPTP